MSSQRWDPESYARNARFVSDLGLEVVELLAARPGERVLDLGCGDGALTERLIAAGCRVVAVDSSPAQVSAARLRGADARVADARALPFEAEFDAVFTNAVLHWIRDADAVIASVARALRPGGRFVGEFGGAGNVGAIHAALVAALRTRGVDAAALDPWFFPAPEAYRARLEAHGFVVSVLALFERPTPLPGDLAEWLETFAQPFLSALAGAERAGLIEEVCAAVRPRLYDAGRGWTADYVRLRFAAERAYRG